MQLFDPLFAKSAISGVPDFGNFGKISENFGNFGKIGGGEKFRDFEKFGENLDFWRLYPGINQGIKSTKNTLF